MTITRVVIKKITRQGINLSIHEKLSSNFPIQNYTNSLAPPNYEFYTHGHAKNTSSPLYSSPSNAILFQRAPLRIFPLPPLLIRFIQRIINRKLLSFFFSPHLLSSWFVVDMRVKKSGIPEFSSGFLSLSQPLEHTTPTIEIIERRKSSYIPLPSPNTR